MRLSPFVCNPFALTPDARTRHFRELGPKLLKLNAGFTEGPDGYAFRFPADVDTMQLLAEWADGERRCCPFFDIDIRVDADGAALWLTLSGREGTKAIIRAALGAWMRA